MNYEDMTEIDLKKLGTIPYSEMNARACVRPEGEGYIAIIIPIFKEDGIRVLKNLWVWELVMGIILPILIAGAVRTGGTIMNLRWSKVTVPI